MIRLLFTTLIFGFLPLCAAELKIAVLHPLLGDLARQIGGTRIEVIDLIGPNGDPHHFEVKPEDLKKAEQATIYLAAGMGLEGYLPKLKTILGDKAQVIEVGATLPALEGACDHEGHDHDHEHEIDPHWWHSIDLFRRATGIVTEVLVKASPSDATAFEQNATSYRTRLDELEKWSKREIARIPREGRNLATAHAAFNYFCKDFGFTAHPVQGINREQMPDPQALAALVADLKKNQVMAIFPEKESNPKILQTLTHDTGIRLGEPLIADGTGGMGYLEMVRHNVSAIVKGLGPAGSP
jgi:zinc/manganese transport system substrate-binding protein